MKTHTTAAVIGITFGALAFVFAPLVTSGQSQAPAVPAKAEQYRLFSLAGNRHVVETNLNNLAADGWRVRLATGDVVIMAK